MSRPPRGLALPLLLALVAQPVLAQSPSLLVSGYTSGAVHRFDLADGGDLGVLGPAPGAQSLRYGPDGHLYACSEIDAQVLRFDGQTGAPLGPFVWDDPATPQDETGGLTTPTGAVFGPDGQLYVASFADDQILRYDGTTGAFIDVFVAAGTGNINGPDAGLDFGPDGDLYVPSFNANRVLRYDGKTGALKGTFAPPGLFELSRPRCLRWRGDGLLYVSSWGNGRINRYDLEGDLVDVFVTTPSPTGLEFDPLTGDLLVTSDQGDSVRRFDGDSGAPLGTLVPANPGSGPDGATFLALFPDQQLHLGRPLPEQAGVTNSLTLRNATPGAVLFLGLAASSTSLSFGGVTGALGVDPDLLLALPVDGAGQAGLSAFVDAALVDVGLALQAYEPASGRLSNLVLASFD